MSGESSLFNYTPPVEQENEEETEFVTVVSLRTDSHKIKGKQYWLASKLDDESFELLLLNENRVPSGDPKVISNGEFAAHYTLELDYYQQHVRPAMEQQNNRLSRGESHREQGEFYSAEMEYAEALAVDEKNVRATFGLGLTYLRKVMWSGHRKSLLRSCSLSLLFRLSTSICLMISAYPCVRTVCIAKPCNTTTGN